MAHNQSLIREFKQIERKVFEKTKAAPILLAMRHAPNAQARIQKFAFKLLNKLATAVSGRKIEQLIHKKLMRNINFAM